MSENKHQTKNSYLFIFIFWPALPERPAGINFQFYINNRISHAWHSATSFSTSSCRIAVLRSPPQTIPRTPIMSGPILSSTGISSNFREPAIAFSSPYSWARSVNFLSSFSSMNSKVDFPSLIAVSTITTSTPAFAAIGGSNNGEIELIRL